MTEHIIVSEAANALRIRINRPEKRNALTFAMYQTMAEALERADSDPAIRVVTLTGTGDIFTSGNDLVDFLEAKPVEGVSPAIRFLTALYEARKPVIAGVNGVAIGVGATMLLHCDLVYAAEEATFQLPFVNLGLVPEAGSSLLLPKMAGYHRAAELLFFGDRFDAHTAREIGLVNRIHPRAALDDILDERSAALAAKPPASLRMTKRLLKGESFNASVKTRMAEEGVHFARQLRSPEAREAMEAFMQKRSPDFSHFS